jgi:hypothetical protein
MTANFAGSREERNTMSVKTISVFLHENAILLSDPENSPRASNTVGGVVEISMWNILASTGGI